MKGFSAIEHNDYFDITYEGEDEPFRVAKGSLSPDKMESIRKRAKKLAMGGYVEQEKQTSPFVDINDGEIPDTTFMADGGGYKVIRTNERKGKTHKVIGPDGSVKYFGDPNLKNRPNNPEAKKAYYARHAKSLKENPHFRAYSRATWSEGGNVQSFQDGGDVLQPPEGSTPDEEIQFYEALQAEGKTLTDEQEKKLKELKKQFPLRRSQTPSGDTAIITSDNQVPEMTQYQDTLNEEQTQELATENLRKEGSVISANTPEGRELIAKSNLPIQAKPVPAALKSEGETPVQSEEPDAIQTAKDLKSISTFEDKKKKAEETRLDMIDAGVAADVAATYVGRALADDRSYRRITSDAFKDALTQGASPEEAELIVRQLDRSGEPINYRQTIDTSQVSAVAPQGAPEKAKEVLLPVGAEKKPAVAEITAKVPATGMPQQISADAAQAKADAVIPRKPEEGAAQVPEADLLQSPEYAGMFRIMIKNGASNEEAKALAKNYAMKVYQSRTLDLRSDDEKRQEQLRLLADEAVKEQEFKVKIELAGAAAKAKLAEQEAQILERKAQNAAMRSRVLSQKREKIRNDIENFKEDPRRFFSSMDEGDRIGFRILAIIAGLDGRGDTMINNIVEKDLQRQRNELSKKQNLLGQYIQEGNEVDQAYNLAKATLKEVYATKLEQALRPLQDPIIQQQGRLTVNKLRQDALKTELDVAKKDADLNFKEVLLQNKIDGMSVDQLIELAKLENASLKEKRLAAKDPYAKDKIFLAYQRENRLREQQIREALGKQTNETTQRFLSGTPMTAAQLNDVPQKIREQYMVPVFDDQNRPTGYFQAANSPQGKKALEGAQIVNKTIIPLLTDLEGQIKASTGPTGLAGWSSTASPAQYKGAQTVQLQLLYQLAQLFELGVVQKSDVDTLGEMIPNLLTYELAGTKQAAVDKFKSYLAQAIRNNREQYLAKTDYTPTAAGTMPPPAPFTPTPVPAAPPMSQPLPIPPNVVPSAAAPKRPAAPAKPPKFKSSSAP